MKLQQLRFLVQVAEAGSFSKAATRLNIAQPALSRQIRLLEEDLGVILFKRDGRGVEATAAGRELVARANVLFADLYEMRQAVMAYRDKVEGRVTIGMMPLLGSQVVPELLLRTRELHPNVKIHFMIGMSHAIIEWTISGRVDFGVVSTAVEGSAYLVTEPIAASPLHLVTRVAPGGPATEALGPVTLADALSAPLVIPTKSNGIRAIIDRYAEERRLAVEPLLEVDSIEIIKRLIRTGIGDTILPYFSITEDVGNGVFTSRPIEEDLNYNVAITFPVERPLGQIALAISSILREVTLKALLPEAAARTVPDYN